MSSNEASDSQPSMIAGHAKYVQGAVSSMLGYETGETTKSEAVQEMRAANENSNSSSAPSSASGGNTVLGSIENAAGKLVGCEGMEKEGEKKTTAGKVGSEEASGTG